VICSHKEHVPAKEMPLISSVHLLEILCLSQERKRQWLARRKQMMARVQFVWISRVKCACLVAMQSCAIRALWGVFLAFLDFFAPHQMYFQVDFNYNRFQPSSMIRYAITCRAMIKPLFFSLFGCLHMYIIRVLGCPKRVCPTCRAPFGFVANSNLHFSAYLIGCYVSLPHNIFRLWSIYYFCIYLFIFFLSPHYVNRRYFTMDKSPIKPHPVFIDPCEASVDSFGLSHNVPVRRIHSAGAISLHEFETIRRSRRQQFLHRRYRYSMIVVIIFSLPMVMAGYSHRFDRCDQPLAGWLVATGMAHLSMLMLKFVEFFHSLEKMNSSYLILFLHSSIEEKLLCDNWVNFLFFLFDLNLVCDYLGALSCSIGLRVPSDSFTLPFPLQVQHTSTYILTLGVFPLLLDCHFAFACSNISIVIYSFWNTFSLSLSLSFCAGMLMLWSSRKCALALYFRSWCLFTVNIGTMMFVRLLLRPRGTSISSSSWSSQRMA
jgi:hypothetical protein